MRFEFTIEQTEKLITDGVLSTDDSILAVCAGTSERQMFLDLGFDDVTISNLDDRMTAEEYAPYSWSCEDAHHLSFSDGEFDFVFVADGLHHCNAPHQALLEMYRVARKGIIVVESRDNLLMRLAMRLNLTPTYELEGVVVHDCTHGGVNNTSIPNYIYRWTEREFEKTIRSNDPTGRLTFRYFYGLNLPFWHAEVKKSRLKYYILRLSQPILRLGVWLFRKQCNSFAMVAIKPGPEDIWPWLLNEGEAFRLSRDYAEAHFKT